MKIKFLSTHFVCQTEYTHIILTLRFDIPVVLVKITKFYSRRLKVSTHISTSEGTPYHSNIESHTAPLKTDDESHLNGPLSTAPHPCSSPPQHTHRYYLILKPARIQLMFHQYYITHPGVHSTLPTLNCIPGHYYSLVLPNFTYLVLHSLTFKNLASYIQDGRTTTLQMLHFIFFFQQM